MIPSKQSLPAITPPGTYGQLVELITAGTELDEHAAERLADSLLFRLGLYGPIPDQLDDWCTAMFFADYPQDSGWVQCSKEPGHIRRGDPLHKAWRGRSWSDDHRQAVAAVDEDI